MDKEEIDKIARKNLLEHQLLTERFKGTVQEVVEAFKLYNKTLEPANYLKSNEIVAVQLYKKGVLGDFNLGLREPNMDEKSLK